MWSVVAEGVSDKLKSMRQRHLPAETGGVVLGFVDHPLRTIFVVDVLSAPMDSEASEVGFVRGVDGLMRKLADVRARTAEIVGYLGEWHSHPPFHGPIPSADDTRLLKHCADALALEGEPALMVIVGSTGEISWSVQDSTCGSSPPPPRVTEALTRTDIALIMLEY